VVHPLADVEVDQWQHDPDGCCAARKVEPLQRALAGRRAWVTGLRRADSPTRADAPIVHLDPFRGVTKVNPLATWSDDDVAHYSEIELLPEHPLTDRGYASIGCWPCTRAVAEGEHARAGRWAGTDKIECGLHR
jgi:phosphoadenosine phosphosulfate reductase